VSILLQPWSHVCPWPPGTPGQQKFNIPPDAKTENTSGKKPQALNMAADKAEETAAARLLSQWLLMQVLH
jgi:hypothetical protein